MNDTRIVLLYLAFLVVCGVAGTIIAARGGHLGV